MRAKDHGATFEVSLEIRDAQLQRRGELGVLRDNLLSLGGKVLCTPGAWVVSLCATGKGWLAFRFSDASLSCVESLLWFAAFTVTHTASMRRQIGAWAVLFFVRRDGKTRGGWTFRQFMSEDFPGG
jgi:hypothetical protein